MVSCFPPVHTVPFLVAFQDTDLLRIRLHLRGNLKAQASHPTDRGGRGCLISYKYASSCPSFHIWSRVRSWRPEPQWLSQHFLDLVWMQPITRSSIIIALQNLDHHIVEVHPWDSKYERYHLLNLSILRVIRGLILRRWYPRHELGLLLSFEPTWLLIMEIDPMIFQYSIHADFYPWRRLSISSRPS